MTERVHDYLDNVERLLLLSPVVHSFRVREREEHRQEGFIRIRATLSNGDFLEAFEFVIATPETIETLTYRIHWQRNDGHVKRRWDNAPHHREISTFPHHVHVGSAAHVESSEPMTIFKALALLETELQEGLG
jgi:hypothetical protein